MRRVDTSALTSATRGIAASQDYILGVPRISRAAGVVRGVLCGDGANQPPTAAYELVRDLADAGFPAIAGDSWDTPGVGWGNPSAVARWRSAWNYLKTQHGAKPDKALLVGISGDGLNALNLRSPTRPRWRPSRSRSQR